MQNPNKNHVRAHLDELFHWVQEIVPDARVEIRVLDPQEIRKPECLQVKVTELDAAADYAIQQNLTGLNVYVLPNVIRPNAPRRFASDTDILGGTHHFIDVDGATDLDKLNLNPQFPFAFIVLTGTKPSFRLHAYWRLYIHMTDLEGGWRATQRALAHAYGTDRSVCNPSRPARLAGTIAYPTQKKLTRGYEVEVTEFMRGDNTPIDNDLFVTHFPVPQPPMPENIPAGKDDGDIPFSVIEAALNAIPPIVHDGGMNEWLNVCHAVISANRGARHLWEAWQRLGKRGKGDDRLWDRLVRVQQSSGKYSLLFRLANENNIDWWRDGGEVQGWWQNRAEQYYASISQSEGGINPLSEREANMGTVCELFPQHAPRSDAEMTKRASLSKDIAEDLIKTKRLEAAERMRQRRLAFLRDEKSGL